MHIAEDLLSRLTWLKHASFLYDGSVRIAFDPWNVSLAQAVDIVLVTHGHHDHCDPDTVNRILAEDGVIVAADACAEQLSGDVRSLRTGEVVTIGDIIIIATDAYNLGKKFHPHGEGAGFLVAVDGGTIFHAGDTDDIPETHNLAPDVALLPVGGTYTMDTREAARAAHAIRAGISVPMHYGFGIGSRDDGEKFSTVASVPTRVLTPVEAFATS